MDCDTHVDVHRAEQAVSSLLLTCDEQQQHEHEYQPKTLQSHNGARYIYLPLYPTKSFNPNHPLLLANVPETRLAPHEIARRQQGGCTPDALMMMKDYRYSSMDEFSLSEQDAEELAARLQVHKSIITFNADRLRGICYTLLAFHDSFRRNVLHQRDVALKEPTFNSKHMVMALEFYLQIDVDTFYMKTCSIRGAEPWSNIEGLFCGKEEPEGRYTLLPCDGLFCSCCHPVNSWKRTSQPWLVVDFVSSSMHQFINGYTTYLNCPATCNTSNVIYTMTCPCGHYDYVDSTNETLVDAMTYHRQHGNRIIHEKLTGTPLFRGATRDPSEREKEIAKQMRLYQHSARCPVALRSFLDCNPIYWCFIPMPWDEALTGNAVHFGSETSSASSNTAANPQLAHVIAMNAIVNPRVARYLEHLPLPPAAYAFSYQQRQKQRLFFEQLLSSPIQQLPYSELDLFKVAIIAVLPDHCSILLRYIIETLFIIHGETQLNMICPLGGDPEKRYGRPYDLVWCANLNHRST